MYPAGDMAEILPAGAALAVTWSHKFLCGGRHEHGVVHVDVLRPLQRPGMWQHAVRWSLAMKGWLAGKSPISTHLPI
jgi:hypothetical protein